MATDFEQIFKSDVQGHTCPNCGEGLVLSKSENGIIIKGRKKNKKIDPGNQMEPHKGGKTGSHIPAKAKGAPLGPAKANAQKPGNRTTQMDKSEVSFPLNKSVSLVSYDEGFDTALSKSIENNGVGGVVAPQRNLLMEQAISKAAPPPKKKEEESESDTSDEESSESESSESESSDE